MTGSRSSDEPDRPLLRVVKGDPTDEELAALVAVFAALGSAGKAGSGGRRTTPEWSAHHRKLRHSYPHGPGAWRASGMPMPR